MTALRVVVSPLLTSKALHEAANILDTAPHQRALVAGWLRAVADEIEPETDRAQVQAMKALLYLANGDPSVRDSYRNVPGLFPAELLARALVRCGARVPAVRS